MKLPITVDFETFGIQGRPDYPPKPVGVAIWIPGRQPRYLAWGHPTENNTTWHEAQKLLKQIWKDPRPKLFHNAKFDLEVAYKWMKLPPLDYHQFEDTLFGAFLHNPHAFSLSLKPMSADLLDMPPDEQDELSNWIRENLRTTEKKGQGDVLFVRDSGKRGYKIPPTKTGAFIAYAPGKLVGRYAIGDVVRTQGLFKLFRRYISEYGMASAYERERRLVPILMKNEQHGSGSTMIVCTLTKSV